MPSCVNFYTTLIKLSKLVLCFKGHWMNDREKAKQIQRCLELAILLEASAHKPGNVSVVTDFENTRYEHFLSVRGCRQLLPLKLGLAAELLFLKGKLTLPRLASEKSSGTALLTLLHGSTVETRSSGPLFFFRRWRWQQEWSSRMRVLPLAI